MNGADDDFKTRSDGTPVFFPDPMLRHTTTKLRGSDDIGHNALADVIENISILTKSHDYQNRELVEIKRQSKQNGAELSTLRELKLDQVVEQHRIIYAANQLWQRRKKAILTCAAGFVFVVGPLIAAIAKRIAETLFP